MNLNTRQHKTSGWTRTATGWGNYLITPTDDSGPRNVAFLSAGSWQNLPNDDRANINRHRVVLIDGNPLPAWAMEWLEKANARACERALENFRAMMEAVMEADDNRTWNGDGY